MRHRDNSRDEQAIKTTHVHRLVRGPNQPLDLLIDAPYYERAAAIAVHAIVEHRHVDLKRGDNEPHRIRTRTSAP